MNLSTGPMVEWDGKKEFNESQIRKRNYSACLRLIKFTTRHNVLKVHSQNSYAHEKLKFDIVYLLRKAGHEIATKVEFKKGGRADVLALSEMVCLELLYSESLIDFESKKSSYPAGLMVVAVQVSEFENDLTGLKKFLGVE